MGKSQAPIFLLIIVVLIAAGVGAYYLSEDEKCPETDSIIQEECKCGDTTCPAGKICKINGSNTSCIDRPPDLSTNQAEYTSGGPSNTADPSDSSTCKTDCGENGECYRGKCICKDGWSGSSCNNSSMNWSRIGEEEGGQRVTEIDGVNYCADNYYQVINDNGGDCILCPKSNLTDDSNTRSKSPNNTSIGDCRCENVNGYNLNYVDFKTKTCTMCPQEEGSTQNNPSSIVKTAGTVGTVDDCVCNDNGGWHQSVNGSGCSKCPKNSTYNILQKKCECKSGYENASGTNECVIKTDLKQYINKCGIYSFDLDSSNDIKYKDDKPIINGTIEDLNDVNIYNSNNPNSSTAMAWYRDHPDQFSFTDSGTCQYKDKDDNVVNCGESGTSASNFNEFCNKCLEGYKLIWDQQDGFQCITEVCDSSKNTQDNIDNCFNDSTIIPTQDKKLLTGQNAPPGNYICKKTDANNPLSKNMCDISILNKGGGDVTGTSIKIKDNSGNQIDRIPDWNNNSNNKLQKSEYSANRYSLDTNSGKIVCGINEDIRGTDGEDNNSKKCLQKNDICGRFNKNEQGGMKENICKNTSKCVNIDVPPYFDCVDPSKQEPLTSVTTNPESQYHKDGTYNKCPNFVIRNGVKVGIIGDTANENEKVIKGYGKLCHLTSAKSDSVQGDGICGWGFMGDEGAVELKKHDDPIGGARITEDGSVPNNDMNSYFNLDITKNKAGTLQYDKYTCDCGEASGIGKHYRDYNTSMDSNTFCFAPTPTTDTVTAQTQTDAGSSGSEQMPWQYMYQAITDKYGEQIPPGNDDSSVDIWRKAIIQNQKISCSSSDRPDICNTDGNYSSDSNNVPFPNSINNLSTYLDCSKLDPKTTTSADGYETGHFYFFDRFNTDIGTGYPPQCLLCSDRTANPDSLQGHNQIHKSWLGWNPDNTIDPKDYNEWKQKWLSDSIGHDLNVTNNNSSNIIMKAKINVGEPSSTGYQEKICGRAYPGYSGTIFGGTKDNVAQKRGIGGENVKDHSLPKRTVPDDYFKRTTQRISDFNCPEDKSLNWAPENFWLKGCNVWDPSTNRVRNESSVTNINNIGSSTYKDTKGRSGSVKLQHGLNVEMGAANMDDADEKSMFNIFKKAAEDANCYTNVRSFKANELKALTSVDGDHKKSEWMGDDGTANYHCRWSTV